jgi:hypothetical protein
MLHPMQMEKPSEPLGTSFARRTSRRGFIWCRCLWTGNKNMRLQRFHWHRHPCTFSVGFACARNAYRSDSHNVDVVVDERMVSAPALLDFKQADLA